MTIRIQLSAQTIKDLTARRRQALARGDRRPRQRITALLLLHHLPCVTRVAAVRDVAESTVYAWMEAFLLRGLASLAYCTSPGRPSKLTPTQKDRLRTLLAAGPAAAGYPTAAWAAPLVQHLIEQQFGVIYNVHYISALLRRLGYSYQKACFVRDHLDDAGRARWLARPAAIAPAALMRNALLLFGDEARFAQWGSLGYTWAPRGHQPVVKTTGPRQGYQVWGLLEWFSGRLFHRGHAGRFTAAGYCAFREEVLAQTDQPVILIQDGARYPTAAETHAWLQRHAERIMVYQLPTYSPDYHPLEHIWRYVKEGTHWSCFPTFAALVARVAERLGALPADPRRVPQLMGTPLDDVSGDPVPAAAA